MPIKIYRYLDKIRKCTFLRTCTYLILLINSFSYFRNKWLDISYNNSNLQLPIRYCPFWIFTFVLSLQVLKRVHERERGFHQCLVFLSKQSEISQLGAECPRWQTARHLALMHENYNINHTQSNNHKLYREITSINHLSTYENISSSIIPH